MTMLQETVGQMVIKFTLIYVSIDFKTFSIPYSTTVARSSIGFNLDPIAIRKILY
jgi:hypothetical protein